ncbi:MAG: tetratricopeptide repeat protein [Melioribacteraceae bacterium]|jgi:tetratricopeptide (TPR) repeat protein|nr:tetratricopeptide repeat protein [Melioribacteraceae bacterium]
MSEMLGNQYFMARNYFAALSELEKVFEKNPTNKSLKRKLIICYTQTNDLEKALILFNELVEEDIEFIIEADAIKDDCPCPELVKELDNPLSTPYFEDEFENLICLGIIWLYCDVSKSYEYFKEAQHLNNQNKVINLILKRIENYIIEHQDNLAC